MKLKHCSKAALLDLFKKVAADNGWTPARRRRYRTSTRPKGEIVGILTRLTGSDEMPAGFLASRKAKKKKPASPATPDEYVKPLTPRRREPNPETFSQEKYYVGRYKRAVFGGPYDKIMSQTAITAYAKMKGFASEVDAEKALIIRIMEDE